MLHTRLLAAAGLGLGLSAALLAPASAQQDNAKPWFIPGQHAAPHAVPRPVARPREAAAPAPGPAAETPVPV